MHSDPSRPPTESAERFRLLVDGVLDYGIFMLDPQGHIVSWNSGARNIKQYQAEEVIGRHFSVFYEPEAVARGWPEEELRRAVETGRYEDEGWRVRKDGSRFWANVVITALRGPDGTLSGFGKVTRDLTERRAQEEKLRESEQRLRLLVEGVREYAIFMLGPTGIIESWNNGAQLIKGYAAQEVIGRHFGMFYRPEDLHMAQAELDTALAHGRAEEEGWRVRKDGSVFWANVVISPVYDADRKLRGFAKVTRDMTERRRLQELENSSRRMNEFLAMLAHELRNPLAPIRNAVTVLQLEPAPSPMVRSARDMIDRQLSHMTRLVDDLLDVGRLTTGKIRLKMQEILYNQVIARSVEAARPLFDARRHRFTAQLPPTDIWVMGDATRLSQVLQNLLVNAAKFTPEGGSIELHVRLDGSQLTTAVKDSGIGITSETMGSIFELFSQGDAQASARESGLGIGLTLARSLVEMHGGALRVDSEGPGRGSTFQFFLPQARAETGDEAAASAAANPRVLIVDDNRDAADSLADILRLMGSPVRIAYDGPVALEQARDYRPQVVLLDLGMPGMNGFEVVRALRELPGAQDMLIAAVTGFGNDEDRQRTLTAGFDVHLTKPVDFTILQEFMAQAQARRSRSGG